MDLLNNALHCIAMFLNQSMGRTLTRLDLANPLYSDCLDEVEFVFEESRSGSHYF